MRIGKYLFLAVAFPPYFALYGLPKWVLVEGLPAIYSMTVWMWKKVQKQAQKYVETCMQKVNQLTKFVQNLALTLIKPFVHLALGIQHGLRRKKEQLFLFFKNKVLKRLSDLRLPFKNVHARFARIKEKWSQKTEQISQKVQEGIQWIREAPQKMHVWVQDQFQNIQHRTKGWIFEAAQRLQKSLKTADRATNWVFNQLDRGIGAFKHKTFVPLMNFYRLNFHPPLQKFAKSCSVIWNKVKEFCHHKQQKMLNSIQAKQEKLKQLSAHRFLQNLLSQSWITKLPSFWQRWIRKLLTHSFTRLVCNQVVKGCTFAVRCLLGAVKGGISLSSFAASYVLKIGKIVRRTLADTVKRMFSLLGFVVMWLRKGFFYLVYYTLLFSVISFMLFIIGMRCLGDSMTALKTRFLFTRTQ